MKMRLLHLSDLHLNRIPVQFRRGSITRFIEASDVRHVVVTGDITSGRFLGADLEWLSRAHPGHLFHLVMGNHDYYGLSFRDAHRVMGKACAQLTNLRWLSTGAVSSLSETTALVGHEGWFCATVGLKPWWTTFSMDAFRIHELRWARKKGMNVILDAYKSMSERSVEAICNSVGQAVKHHDHVVIATHFPPWTEATDNKVWGYIGRRWQNYDVNRFLGLALEDIARNRREKQFTVLAGHTHVPCVLHVSSNLTCRVSCRTTGESIVQNVIGV